MAVEHTPTGIVHSGYKGGDTGCGFDTKDSGRYKVANCTQAQPVFYGFAGLPDGKVILVSVLTRSPPIG